MADYKIKINAEDNTKGAISSINKGLGGLSISAGKLKGALVAAGGALAAFGVANKVKDTIDSFDNLAKSARMAGAASSEAAFKGFQVLQTAMGEAGIDAATFERAMLQTTSRLKAGTEGQKSFAKVTDKLGDGILDMNGKLKTGPELLQTMINALNEGTITTEDFAKVVGGRAGPLIQQQFASIAGDAEGLAAIMKDVEANSNIVSLEAGENAEKFNDTVGRLEMAFQQLMTDAITPLLPMLVDLAENILAKMPAFIEGVKNAFETLQPVFSLLGTVLSEVIVPFMKALFEVLGSIATAISPLVEAAIPALKAAFEGIQSIIESLIGFFGKVVDGLTAIGDKAKELKDGVTGSFKSMKDSVVDTAGNMTDSVTGFFSDMYQKVVGGSIVPDMVNGVLSEFNRMSTGMQQSSATATSAVTQDFNNLSHTIENDFANSLSNALSDGKLTLSDFQGFFSNVMTQLINDALRGGNGIGNIFSSLFSGLGGLFGGSGGGGGIGSFFSSAVSSIGSFFGGLFADGGYLGTGQVGIVGEAGPELITGPANITPMDQMGGSVTININAIDTQTGTQFLLDNKGSIEGIIQNAYNRRGKPGIA
jgi:predicted PurR-regulated permease PerM